MSPTRARPGRRRGATPGPNGQLQAKRCAPCKELLHAQLAGIELQMGDSRLAPADTGSQRRLGQPLGLARSLEYRSKLDGGDQGMGGRRHGEYPKFS